MDMMHTMGVITNPELIEPNQIQPNGVDLIPTRIIQMMSTYCLKEKKYYFNLNSDVKLTKSDDAPHGPDGEYWDLLGGHMYQFETEVEVKIPPNHSGFIIARSTLKRHGINVTSALYDSGYKGIVGGQIFMANHSRLYLHPNERIGQLVIIPTRSIKDYDGNYQNQTRL
jgi:deoxycytidine triphosphate deaminase